MAANYANVNAAWPDHAPVPSAQEAIAGARRLVRLALTLGPPGTPPKKFRGRFEPTSGNRYTWPRRGVFYVNPDCNGRDFGGWKGIVHGISHWAGRRLYAGAKPHDHRVAYIERVLTEHVVTNGWLEGKLRSEPKAKPPRDLKRERYERTLAAIKRWDSKRRRAETALRKLESRRRRYALTEPALASSV